MKETQSTRYSGHETSSQARHEASQVWYDTPQAQHDTPQATQHNTPTISPKSSKATTITNNVPAGTNNVANF